MFGQLGDFLPKIKFDCFVKKYDGNKYVKKFTCWNHLLVMIFDRGYMDTEQLKAINMIGTFFVISSRSVIAAKGEYVRQGTLIAVIDNSERSTGLLYT